MKDKFEVRKIGNSIYVFLRDKLIYRKIGRKVESEDHHNLHYWVSDLSRPILKETRMTERSPKESSMTARSEGTATAGVSAVDR
jgi:hypothetical protein